MHNPNPFALEETVAAARPVRTSHQPQPYCRFPFFHVSINSNGHVMACPFAHGEAPLGIVGPDMPFERIWLGPAFTELRQRILTNDPPDMCRRCSYLASSQPDRAELFNARPN